MAIVSGGIAYAQDVIDRIADDAPRGVLAFGRRTTASSVSTGSTVGVLELDDIPIYTGRAYKIWTSCLNLDTTIANDVAMLTVRYTTDGSTPATTSTILPGAQMREVLVNATSGPILPLVAYYEPSADETLSLLLCVIRVSGTGNVTLYGDSTHTIDLIVEDVGPAVGDTGVDI